MKNSLTDLNAQIDVANKMLAKKPINVNADLRLNDEIVTVVVRLELSDESPGKYDLYVMVFPITDMKTPTLRSLLQKVTLEVSNGVKKNLSRLGSTTIHDLDPGEYHLHLTT